MQEKADPWLVGPMDGGWQIWLRCIGDGRTGSGKEMGYGGGEVGGRKETLRGEEIGPGGGEAHDREETGWGRSSVAGNREETQRGKDRWLVAGRKLVGGQEAREPATGRKPLVGGGNP